MDYDVAIVGYGPIGGLMANLLGARGLGIVIIEKETEIYGLPRAVGLDDEVMRVLQSLDLELAFKEHGAPLLGMNLLRPNRKRLRRISVEQEEPVLGHPVLQLFHQPTFEKHVRNGLSRYSENVDVRLGAEVLEIREESDRMLLEIMEQESGELTTVSAKYLLGCDGGRSLVRKTFEIKHEDFGLHQPWVVVDVLMNRPFETDGYADQICDPERPGTFVPTAAPRKRWEFMVSPKDDQNDVLKESSLAKLLRPWVAPGEYEIERAAIYTFHAILAKQWRVGGKGNVLLVGDAAHQMPPFLGQGMCAGVRDAFNLGWKLELVLKGLSPPSILDTYQSERSEHVRQVICTAVRVGSLIQSSNVIKTYLIHATMVISEWLGIDLPLRAAKWLPIGNGFFSRKHAPQKVARTPFPQPTIQTSEGNAHWLDNELGPYFTLLSRDLPTQSLEQNAYVKQIRVHSPGSKLPTHEPNSIVDTDGALNAWMDENKCDAVLLRPDRQAFGVYRGRSNRYQYILNDLKTFLPDLCDPHTEAHVVSR